MVEYRLSCIECGATWRPQASLLTCPNCAAQQQSDEPVRGVLRIDAETLPTQWPNARMSLPEFVASFLPLKTTDSWWTFPVGDTPLLSVPALRTWLDVPQLWVKDDTRNPSGSTKDRASALVVNKAREFGFHTVATASTGNAATALAACGAAVGLRVVVFVPATAPRAKLIQILAYGAHLIPIDGTYDQAFDLSIKACQAFGWYNRNTAANPYTVEGKKTCALEIAAQMNGMDPEVVFVPVGDGVILCGVAKGFADLKRAGLIHHVPRLIAVQPEGSCAIAHAFHSGKNVQPQRGAGSLADSLTVEMPRNATWCLREIRRSGGSAVVVSDDQIASAVIDLAVHSGVFAEPAGAACLAGLRVALEQGVVDGRERIVLLVTGNGLKDPFAAEDQLRVPPAVSPDLNSVSRIMTDTHPP